MTARLRGVQPSGAVRRVGIPAPGTIREEGTIMLHRILSWLHRPQVEREDWHAFNVVPFDSGLGEY